MEAPFAVGHPVYHQCPALQLVDASSHITTEEVQWITHLAGTSVIIFLMCIFFPIGKCFSWMAMFEEEREQVKECSIIASLQDENEIEVRMHACTHV